MSRVSREGKNHFISLGVMAVFSRLDPIPRMAVILGKRKRRTQIEELDPQVVADTNADTGEERQELFRKHFEAKFAPLPRLLRQNIERQTTETHTLKDEEVSDWEGLSDGDDDTNVQVVVHNISIGTTRADVPKDELKTFMVIHTAMHHATVSQVC